MSPEDEACCLDALARTRRLYGESQPEWWCLELMARYFLETYGRLDDPALPARHRPSLARQVIERDNYTCAAPECLQRGGLHADHIRLRSQNGPTVMSNMVTLCKADHLHLKHRRRTLIPAARLPTL